MSDLKTFVSQLQKDLEQRKLDNAVSVLSQAKRALLQQGALFPSTSLSPQVHSQAREILELGAITSLRLMDSESFIRYYQQLQPFYDFEREVAGSTAAYKDISKTSQRSKITGLYLLLLLSSGDTSQFHTVLEGLIVEASLKGHSVEDEPFIKYPVELERSLMEGSYDKVWRATKSSEVPTEDFGLFSNVWFCSPSGCLILSFAASDNKIHAGPCWYDPKGDRRLLGTGLPVTSDSKRKEPFIPRVRGCRHPVRTGARMDYQRWPHILPRPGRCRCPSAQCHRGSRAHPGRTTSREGYCSHERHGHPEYNRIRKGVGDYCLIYPSFLPSFHCFNVYPTFFLIYHGFRRKGSGLLWCAFLLQAIRYTREPCRMNDYYHHLFFKLELSINITSCRRNCSRRRPTRTNLQVSAIRLKRNSCFHVR